MARASRHASPGRHGRARGRVRVGVDDGQGCVRRRRFIRAGYGAILGLDVVLRNTKLGRQTPAGQKMKHAHQVSVPELGEWLSDTRQGTCARGRVGAGALGGAGAYDRHSAGDAQLSRVSKCLARLTTAAAVTSKIHGVAQTVLVAALTESYARDVPVGGMREGCELSETMKPSRLQTYLGQDTTSANGANPTRVNMSGGGFFLPEKIP